MDGTDVSGGWLAHQWQMANASAYTVPTSKEARPCQDNARAIKHGVA